MRMRFLKSIIAMSTVLVVAPALPAQSGQQDGAGEAEAVRPAPTRDMNGIWARQAGDPSLSSIHSLSTVERQMSTSGKLNLFTPTVRMRRMISIMHHRQTMMSTIASQGSSMEGMLPADD